MLSLSSTRYFLLALLFSVLLSGFGGCGEAPWISGRVVVDRAGDVQPIPGARLFLYPVAPLSKGKPPPEQVENLSGVATTLSSGTFEFSELTSSVSYESFELLRDWRYRVRIEDTAYYLKDIEFDYQGGQNYLEVRLEEKKVDVEASDGEGIGEDNHSVETGSVKRGQ